MEQKAYFKANIDISYLPLKLLEANGWICCEPFTVILCKISIQRYPSPLTKRIVLHGKKYTNNKAIVFFFNKGDALQLLHSHNDPDPFWH